MQSVPVELFLREMRPPHDRSESQCSHNPVPALSLYFMNSFLFGMCCKKTTAYQYNRAGKWQTCILAVKGCLPNHCTNILSLMWQGAEAVRRRADKDLTEAGAPAEGLAAAGADSAEKPSQGARDADGDTVMSEEEKERAASGEKASTSGRAAVPGVFLTFMPASFLGICCILPVATNTCLEVAVFAVKHSLPIPAAGAPL